MRIVVSGTHASGKSTLISDFATRHPEFAVLSDPFELLDESTDAASAASFGAQLGLSAERLRDPGPPNIVAERGPVDFLAYLLALDDLGRITLDDDVIELACARSREALARVDLLVVLPLTAAISVEDDEDPRLRAAMDARLLELIDDPDAVGDRVVIAEITGDRSSRLATLETLVSAQIA
ncbi:hypothetical protein [Microbacterium sp. NPDC089695]|uniref:hypothetical protein n=1 Tax=Microbacterium sp. NPDC089695 TaxID=3364198 RepID=UPI00380E6E28